MPVKAQATGIVDQPAYKVFQFHPVNHVQNHPRWDPNIRLDDLNEGPMRAGKTIKRINSRSGKLVEGTLEVVEFESDQAVTMLIHDGPVRLIARAAYEAEGDNQTRLTMKIEFSDIDEMDTTGLVTAMQGSIRDINRLLTSEA